jgi:hypothetical protein
MLSRALAASKPWRLSDDATAACVLELSLAHASIADWQPQVCVCIRMHLHTRIHAVWHVIVCGCDHAYVHICVSSYSDVHTNQIRTGVTCMYVAGPPPPSFGRKSESEYCKTARACKGQYAPLDVLLLLLLHQAATKLCARHAFMCEYMYVCIRMYLCLHTW